MILLLLTFNIVNINCLNLYGPPPQEPKIVGGYYANINSVPYQVQIVRKGIQICGAAIISENWVISAAHCFSNAKLLVIRTGSKFRSQGELHEIQKVFVPKTYNPKLFDNDISLILLKKPIRFNENQKPIAISSREPRIGDDIIISGFGKEHGRAEPSKVLKVAKAPVVDENFCTNRYHPLGITDNMFCAGVGNTDSCQGDSGGPAVINNKLVGIVSWGQYCASVYYPGVYTKVYKYRNWINKITGIITKNSSLNLLNMYIKK